MVKEKEKIVIVEECRADYVYESVKANGKPVWFTHRLVPCKPKPPARSSEAKSG